MKALCFLVLLLTTTAACAQDCGDMVYAGGTCVPPDVAMPKSQRPQTQSYRQGLWVDMWGALALDRAKGILGVSVQNQTEAKAWQAAEDSCHAKGGVNCEHFRSYVDKCVAVVNEQNGSVTNFGKTQEEAIKKAMKMCSKESSDCEVFYSACSLPIIIP